MPTYTVCRALWAELGAVMYSHRLGHKHCRQLVCRRHKKVTEFGGLAEPRVG